MPGFSVSGAPFQPMRTTADPEDAVELSVATVSVGRVPLVQPANSTATTSPISAQCAAFELRSLRLSIDNGACKLNMKISLILSVARQIQDRFTIDSQDLQFLNGDEILLPIVLQMIKKDNGKRLIV